LNSKQKHKVKIDFRPFIHVEGVNAKEIRLQKIDLNTAIILTSRNSDHRVADEMRFKVPEGLKYFCQSEGSFYLQKYVVYRKRKFM
jgi:uroporphyrinogen-III synthase